MNEDKPTPLPQAQACNPHRAGQRAALAAGLALLALTGCGMKVGAKDTKSRIGCGDDFTPSCSADGQRQVCEAGVVQRYSCGEDPCVSGLCCPTLDRAQASAKDGACVYSCESGYANSGSATKPNCVVACDTFPHAAATLTGEVCSYECQPPYRNHGTATAPDCQRCEKGFVNTGDEDAPVCELTAVCQDALNIRRRDAYHQLQDATPCTDADGGPFCVQENTKTPARCVGRDALTFKMTWRHRGGGESVTFKVTDEFNGPKSDFDLDCDGDGVFEKTGLTGLDQKGATYKCVASPTQKDVTISLRGFIQHLDVTCVLEAADDSEKYQKLIAVPAWGLNPWRTMQAFFSGCDALTTVDPTGPNLTQAKNLSGAFNNTPAFQGDVEAWDTANITEMNGVFRKSGFAGSLRKWDVSNVTSMNIMFQEAASFNGEISDWDVSKVTNMTQMFEKATKFNCDISGWEVRQVKKHDKVFNYASSMSNAHKPTFKD